MTTALAPSFTGPSLQDLALQLAPFGWTGARAEWITLVCFHSGVFTRSQYAARYDLALSSANNLVAYLVREQFARERPMPHRGFSPARICHIHSRRIYRALGIENIRHRRTASTDLLLRRLLSLDHVLEHPDLHWLPTEESKRNYFRSLDVPDVDLPHREYTGAIRSTRRYFALKLPIAAGETEVRFVFVDPGPATTTQPLHRWARAHASLWTALQQRGKTVHVAAVTRSPLAAAATSAALSTWRGQSAPSVSSTQLSPEDQAFIQQFEHANATGQWDAVASPGQLVATTRRYHRLKPLESTAMIDSYSIHDAPRLSPDLSAI